MENNWIILMKGEGIKQAFRESLNIPKYEKRTKVQSKTRYKWVGKLREARDDREFLMTDRLSEYLGPINISPSYIRRELLKAEENGELPAWSTPFDDLIKANLKADALQEKRYLEEQEYKKLEENALTLK